MKRILIIEDNPAIAHGLSIVLHGDQYDAVTSIGIEEGYEYAETGKYDLIIIDLEEAETGSFKFCRKRRSAGDLTPILLILNSEDKININDAVGVSIDECLLKPFSLGELTTKIKRILNDNESDRKLIEVLKANDIDLDSIKQGILASSNPAKLSASEYKIFLYFLRHEAEVISNEQLLDETWGYGIFPTPQTVAKCINSLQSKIEENPSEPKHLVLVSEEEYQFVR